MKQKGEGGGRHTPRGGGGAQSVVLDAVALFVSQKHASPFSLAFRPGVLPWRFSLAFRSRVLILPITLADCAQTLCCLVFLVLRARSCVVVLLGRACYSRLSLLATFAHDLTRSCPSYR